LTGIIKIGDRDFTLDPGPFHVTGVQLSGSMPGGHGSASFEVPVANAYLAAHHVLKEGAWIKIFDDAHELYEGEIFSIKPSFDGTQHKLSVTCGGLISVAGKRADVTATWVHRGPEGWILRPGAGITFGEARFDNGVVDVRGLWSSAVTSAMIPYVDAVFTLDDLTSDDTISYISCDATFDTTTNAGNTWQWSLFTGTSLATPYAEELVTYANGSGTLIPLAYTPVAGQKVVMVRLLCTVGSAAGTRANYVSLANMAVFGQGRTTKPRLDEAMVQLATRTGLATSSLSEPVGAMLDDLRVGNGLAKVTAAGGMDYLAGLYAQPFEWGFWDERRFICKPMPSAPTNDSQVIVVGADSPPDSWDVAVYDEDVPQYACVHFGNKDDATLPEGWPRRLYRPTTPPDDADLKVEIVDYSALILKDVDAASAGDNIVSATSTGIPDGYTFDAVPALAKLGKYPGNNTDPTSVYQDAYSVLVSGTLSGFGYTTASGWAGSNSPADPSCLVGDGVNDYVDFSDVNACDFGTGAFTVRTWVKLGAVPIGTTAIAGKVSSGQGWTVAILSSGKVYGYVGASVANYRAQTGSTVLTLGVWYHVTMVYAGSGGDIALYVNGVAETLTAAGAVGAWNTSNAASLLLLGGS